MIYDRVDCQAGCAVYLEFAGNVASVGHYCVDGEEEPVCYFFVGHSFYHKGYDLFFPGAERFTVGIGVGIRV